MIGMVAKVPVEYGMALMVGEETEADDASQISTPNNLHMKNFRRLARNGLTMSPMSASEDHVLRRGVTGYAPSDVDDFELDDDDLRDHPASDDDDCQSIISTVSMGSRAILNQTHMRVHRKTILNMK